LPQNTDCRNCGFFIYAAGQVFLGLLVFGVAHLFGFIHYEITWHYLCLMIKEQL
jgi:hypothetical protein